MNCPVFIDISQTWHYKVAIASIQSGVYFFMHCCLMFGSHFSAGLSFVVVLDRFFYFGRPKKVIAGRVRQVIVLYSNNCMAIICLGGISISRRLLEVVIWAALNITYR